MTPEQAGGGGGVGGVAGVFATIVARITLGSWCACMYVELPSMIRIQSSRKPAECCEARSM